MAITTANQIEQYTKTFTSFSGADIRCVYGNCMLMEARDNPAI